MRAGQCVGLPQREKSRNFSRAARREKNTETGITERGQRPDSHSKAEHMHIPVIQHMLIYVSRTAVQLVSSSQNYCPTHRKKTHQEEIRAEQSDCD